MARLPRLSLPGWPHLLLQRGHNRQPVCVDAADVAQLTTCLAEATRTHGVVLHAYAVGAEGLRLLLTPKESDAMARLMQSLGRRYGAYFNRRHARSGGLWEGRFRATVIEPERHLLEAMVWVETPDDAPHAGALAGASSLLHHVGEQQDLMVGDHAQYWALGNTPFERELAYRRQLAQALSPRVRALLTDAVLRGWPLGSAEFVAALAGVTERRLSPLPRGRRVRAKA